MRVLFGCLVGLALAGCEARQSTATNAPARPVVPVVAPMAVALDTADYMRSTRQALTYHAALDTLISLGTRHYWLYMSQATDSTRPFDYGPTRIVGRHFAAPSDSSWQRRRVRGYEGTYRFVLRDSTHRRVLFSQQLHKRDLLPVASAETVTVSEPDFYYLGYSSGLHALLFQVEVWIPSSDVGSRAALLLDARTGRVQKLSSIGSVTFEATDCDPRVSPTGRAVLTCADELLRAGQPPLSLRRPHAELWATRFLTDTTLLAVYQFGDYQPRQPDPDEATTNSDVPDDPRITAGFYLPDEEFVSTDAQRQLANAFVLGTSGRVLAKFRYDNWAPDMGYSMPYYYSAATRTYYLLSGPQVELLQLPKSRPGTVVKLPLKSLPSFKPPRRPSEEIFSFHYDSAEYMFYVDKAAPHSVRVRRLAE